MQRWLREVGSSGVDVPGGGETRFVYDYVILARFSYA